MSIFGNILSKIFHHDKAQAPAQPVTPAAQPGAVAPQTPPSAPPASHPQTVAAEPAPAVDVGAVLETMASMKADHGGNYKTSIVDLLKLLDLDSSLSARKELAQELGVHASADGSAEQNIALHRAVMVKLVENGGVVPDSLRH